MSTVLVSQKIKTIQFSSGSNYKENYLEATKYAAQFIKSKWNLSFHYKKENDMKSITMTIYFNYDESKLVNHRCEVCKEFHHSFFINDETNCNACKMIAYRRELENEVKRLSLMVKGDLKLDV